MAESNVLRRRISAVGGREGETNDGSNAISSATEATDAAAATAAVVIASTAQPTPRFSSGVAFYPPSDRYWRIGGRWYDFDGFLNLHPGGPDVLKLARDRFEDATFVFESHHPDYRRARAIIRKYEVDVSVVRSSGMRRGPPSKMTATPRLLDDSAFYSVMRRRVTGYLRAIGHARGGPTSQCIALFWASFVSWSFCYLWLLWSGSVIAAVCLGFTAAWLGAFGHNWVHQVR
jgi:hypothetical protein